MKINTLAIIGVGLIGGSIARAARERGVALRIVGTDQHARTLQLARTQGVLDAVFEDLPAAVAEAEVVVWCTPVDHIAEQIQQVADACQTGALLTDAGSTKARIVRALEGNLPSRVAYVGSHPLAGSEKCGVEHARGDLFADRLVVVTPGRDATDTEVTRTCGFWQALGARTCLMDPEEHDQALAWTSHLPHLASSALAGILPAEWVGLTATGFRDVTRLAAGSPEVWTAIFENNRPALLQALNHFEEQLQRFRNALEQKDSSLLEQLLQEGKSLRDRLS